MSVSPAPLDTTQLPPGPTRRGLRGAHLVRAGVVLAVVALCVLGLGQLNLSAVASALASCDVTLLVLAALINLTFNTWVRVRRWQDLLRALPPAERTPGWRELTALYFASAAATNLLPARAGELLRASGLQRRRGYRYAELAAVLGFEKVAEAMSLGLVALPLLILVSVPSVLLVPMLSFLAVALGGLGLGWWLRYRFVPRDGLAPTPASSEAASAGLVRRWLGRVGAFLAASGHALARLSSGWTAALTVMWSLLSDLLDVSMLVLCLLAVGIPVEPALPFLVYLALNLAMVIPGPPGHVGTLEAGAVVALAALGVNADLALAFALLYHAIHVLPVTLVGLFALRSTLRRAKTAEVTGAPTERLAQE